jgi:hypothetical protein
MPGTKQALKTNYESWARWYTPAIPAFRRQKQEDHKASLDYMVRPCLKPNQKHKKIKTQTRNSNIQTARTILGSLHNSYPRTLQGKQGYPHLTYDETKARNP